jgi:hypothetical protein
MSTNGRPPGWFTDDAEDRRREAGAGDPDDHRKALEEYDEFVQRAIEFEAENGFWPPDPLLDEVAEMRRRVLAEHGNDYQKVLEWYVELGKQRAAQNGNSANGAKHNGVGSVSGR